MRKGIWLNVLQLKFKGQDEIKLGVKRGPPGLLRIQPFGLLDIGQLLVVCENEEGMPGPFQPMPPLFQGQFDVQKLKIPYIIIWCS